MRNAARQLRQTLPWRLQGSRRTDTCAPCDPPLCCQYVPQAGLSEEEVVIPELHEKAHDGTVKEARMDDVVSRPRGLGRWMIDVRTVGRKSATAVALAGTGGAFRTAEQEMQRRYKGHAQAPSVELRGGIASTGLNLLEQLSWEAAIAKPSNGSPTRLVRQWCRDLYPVLPAKSEQSALCFLSFV